jgi:uncharacterized repeat protein (TIGR01451 family)
MRKTFLIDAPLPDAKKILGWMTHTWRRVLLPILLIITIASGTAHAWPTAGQWIPVYRGGFYLQDDIGDANGSRNIVSDANNPAAYMFNDGTYIHFRLRLDASPAGSGGQGLLQSFGWGVLFDTDANPANYEWLMMVDGIASTELVELWQNTSQKTLGDPSDSSEILAASVPASGNIQISLANTSFNGNPDFFLDWRFPYATFKQYTGLTDYSPLRLFFGSSNNANSLSADLVGASDLYSGLSDVSTPFGTMPTTGAVKFVADPAGNGDVIQITAGDTLYIRVDDGDVNYDNATKQTVTVTLRATSGDTATVTLTETGVNTGIFTGSIPTQSGAAVANDGILQVTPGATVNAEYIDGIDASYNRNQIRADSLWVVSLEPAISLVKSVDQAAAAPGTELVYTIHYRNVGMGAAVNLIIADAVPLFTTYVAGSLRIGSAASTYATATALTDAADGDAGQATEGSVIFTIPSVAANDNVPDSGSDEGKVYFKARID